MASGTIVLSPADRKWAFGSLQGKAFDDRMILDSPEDRRERRLNAFFKPLIWLDSLFGNNHYLEDAGEVLTAPCTT